MNKFLKNTILLMLLAVGFFINLPIKSYAASAEEQFYAIKKAETNGVLSYHTYENDIVWTLNKGDRNTQQPESSIVFSTAKKTLGTPQYFEHYYDYEKTGEVTLKFWQATDFHSCIHGGNDARKRIFIFS